MAVCLCMFRVLVCVYACTESLFLAVHKTGSLSVSVHVLSPFLWMSFHQRAVDECRAAYRRAVASLRLRLLASRPCDLDSSSGSVESIHDSELAFIS